MITRNTSEITQTSSSSLSPSITNETVAANNANDLIASSLWGTPRTVILERESGKSVGISIVGMLMQYSCFFFF